MMDGISCGYLLQFTRSELNSENLGMVRVVFFGSFLLLLVFFVFCILSSAHTTVYNGTTLLYTLFIFLSLYNGIYVYRLLGRRRYF